MKEVDQLYWFYSIWWQDQERHINCLVNLNSLDVPRSNNGFWVISEQDSLVLKRVVELNSGIVLVGKAIRWSVDF